MADADKAREYVESKLDTYREKYGDVPNDPDGGPSKREDCFFDVDEEDILFDAWQVLAEEGDDVEELGRLIEATTIYDRDNLQQFREDVILD